MKYDDTATDVLDTRPGCDICQGRPAAVDGATRMGPWAYMCVPCFDTYGVGLGLGRGQRLLIEENDMTEPDFRFEITPLPEPDFADATHLVQVFCLETGDMLDSVFTGDPYGMVEAMRERQAMPDLEERLAYYAGRGW